MGTGRDLARAYPKRGLTADVGFRSEPKFCGDGSVELDGSTQGATSATSYSIATSGAKTTLAGWALPRSLAGSNQTLFGNAVNGASDNFAIYQTGTNELAAIAVYAGGVTNVRVAAKNLDKDRWYFLAATFDFDTTTIKFYVDGVEFSETPFLGYGGTGGLFEIGFRDDPGGDIQFFDGNLANVMLIEDVLTQSEVVELMRDTTFAKAQTFGTVNRYYELDADFNDSTGSHNATSVGSPSFGVNRPQLPRGLSLTQNAAMARCLTGRAVDFDGSTDFLDMGVGVNKNYTTRSDRASFSFWFNMDQISSPAFIYQNRGQVGSTDRPECETQVFTISTGLFFDGEGASVQVPVANLKLNQWHHFVGIADDSDGPVKVYLDGVLYDTTGIAQAGANGSEFIIGGRNNSPLQLFNGRLSNFKIFNVELTQAQVRELYHNPEMVIPTGVSASNLRRHYPLCAYNDTGGMGGLFEFDQGAEAVNGEYGGSPVMDFAQPVPCPQLGLQQSATRLRFPGGTTTHNAVATTAALGTTASVSCWFQVENTSSTRVLWAIGNAAGAAFLEVFVSSSDVLQIFGGGAITIATITDSDWHHLVVTTNSGSPPYKAFLDNSEVSLSGSDTARNLTNGTFEIGNQDTFGSPFVFQGILNDVACWNTELSSSDVSALYNSGVMGMDVGTVQASNLKGWWKCDDLSTFKDFSGNGANATVTNDFGAVQFPENASGSTLVGDFSMKRKGVSVLNCFNDPGAQHVRSEIPSGAGLQPSLTNGHTVTCWYRNQKQNTTSANNGTMVLGGNDGSNDRFILEAFNGNTFRGIYGAQTANGTATISDNEWHHYAMVLDVTTASPTVRLYLDGVAAGTKSGSLSTTFPEGKVVIGGLNTTTTRATFDYGLKGPIACPRIYAFQLSENEIKQIYHADERLMKGLNNE